MPPGKLGGIALAQLQAWEAKARDWPLSFSAKASGLHMVCRVCRMTIVPITDTSSGYVVTHNITLAATVAHMRSVHGWLEREVYQDGQQDPESDNRPGGAIAGHGSNRDGD